MSQPEFSRIVRIDTLGAGPREMRIEADAAEQAALARRFGLVAIDRLEAELALGRGGEEVTARGTLRAAVTQSCVVTGELVPETVEAPFTILFRPPPEGADPDEEVELSEAEMDVVFYDGARIDVGEAVAETLSLSVDPWPRSPAAGEALKEAGVKSEEDARAELHPFGALAALRDRLGK